jgi:ubiquinone/menaquinone biosynthesis C-methylase UbiE
MSSIESDIRSLEIASSEDELASTNREVWKHLGIKQTDTAVFFPAPNALVPIMFARFMNKRKVTFVDTNEISVSTLIKLSAQMRLSNVSVKLANSQGKFPVSDNGYDVAFSDWGLSYFVSQTNKASDAETIAKELVRTVKTGGRVAAIEDNGAPVMFPCPPDIVSIRTKIDLPRSERLLMGRRLYSLYKSNNLKNVSLFAFSKFLPGDEEQKMNAELSRRIAAIESFKENSALGVSVQEIEKYKGWLKSQIGNKSFLIQFNSILAVGEK